MAAARACASCGERFEPRKAASQFCDKPACRRERERVLKAEQRARRTPSSSDDLLRREELVVAYLERNPGPDAPFDALHAVLFPVGFRRYVVDRRTRREARARLRILEPAA
jgi:hypothetical protein